MMPFDEGQLDPEPIVPPVLILVGGHGSRLLPVTRGAVPKPLVSVGHAPFLQYVLRTLCKNGASIVRVCAGHLAGQVRDYLAIPEVQTLFRSLEMFSDDGTDSGCPRGTGHAVRQATADLTGPFLVMNGDTLLDVPLKPVIQSYFQLAAKVLVVSCETRYPGWVSNMAIGEDGRATYEKRGGDGFTHTDAGLYVLARQVLDEWPEESELPRVLEAVSKQGRLRTFVSSQRYYDINTPESLEEADRVLLGRTEES